jgi:predicted Zn-dependent peptidase
VTDAIPHVETLSLGLWVNVGTRHEMPEINGISHFLEHMAFKGTARRSAIQIAEEIENVGGYLNAYTGRETTAYYGRILKENGPLVIDILADILQHSTFDATEFNREQGVILQEIGQSNDTPDDIVFDYFQEALYPNQTMGLPTLGTEEIIRRLTPTEIDTYLKSTYNPGDMVFAAAGNLDHDAIVKMVDIHFNALPQGANKQNDKAEYVGGDKRIARDLEQVHLLMGFEGVPFGHDNYYVFSVLSMILGGGMASRLFQEIREKRGLVYSVYSYNTHYRDNGVFAIYAGTGPDEVAELVPATCDVLKTSLNGFSPEEISRAKAQIKASLLMSLESTSGRCERLANQTLIYGRNVPVSEVITKIDAVTLTDLTRVLEGLLQSKPTLTALGPIENVMPYDALLNELRK